MPIDIDTSVPPELDAGVPPEFDAGVPPNVDTGVPEGIDGSVPIIDGSTDFDGPACGDSGRLFRLSFAVFPQLTTVGGAAHVQIPGYSDPACGNDDVMVVQLAAGLYAAFAASCNHACCVPVYVRATNQLKCPCHGATWDANGAIVPPSPATAPLQRLPVCADANGVTVSF